MADQNSGNGILEIKLNEVFVAKRKLRYIYLCHPNVVSTVWDEKCECTPLFLGSDVLGECNVSHGNLPRIHAKHATKGLATKVNFPPCTKVLGIHGTARGVWFYSVQGVFKIAFEYYARLEQDGCLKELEKVWRSCLLDPVLKTEIHVVVGQQMQLSCEQSGEQRLASTLSSDSREKSLGVRVPRESQRGIVRDLEDVTNCQDKNEIVKQISKLIDKLGTHNEKDQHELGLLKIYISFLDQEDNKADCFVNSTVNMFKNCLALLPAISECCDFTEKEIILSEIAGWLGTEFSNYYGYVSERVTHFKQKHIRSIENLPCAEILINEVFPMSMQILFCSWLKLTPSDNQIPANSGDSLTLFPVIQIILELANRNLLSGVAHVLYSRLILSESV